ncbi:MarR family transcriptional regulator [Candidatus Woesearchaeota archaeon]|nr:MarR family transcriptional regulator [Candidatus Woesearchaeota archaeon]
METKKLGFLIMGMTIALGAMMFGYVNNLDTQGQSLNCNPTQECQQINSSLGISHMAIGILAFIFSLGFYLLFFNKNEKEILEKYGIGNFNTQQNNNLETTNNQNSINNNINPNNGNNLNANDEKFSLLLRPLDDNERKVLTAIKEQEGITQSTLRYRADLSKSKVSQILTDFEKKRLIERKAKGKTYSVFLTDSY